MTSIKKGIINATVIFLSLCLLNLLNAGEAFAQTEPPANPALATRLQTICHFISKDTIKKYTADFQAWKKSQTIEQLAIFQAFADGSSFNKETVAVILAQTSCIGLRVLYGLGPDKKFHVILVGIRKDYTNIYIRRKDICPDPKSGASIGQPTQRLAGGASASPLKMEALIFDQDNEEGGAEMGQIP